MIMRMFSKLNVNLKNLVSITPRQLCCRICISMVPPVTTKYKKKFIDIIGPVMACIVITLILNYGNSIRASEVSVLPLESVLLYMLTVPFACYVLNRIGQSNLTFLEIFSIMGYALYGHIITLLISLLFYSENSNAFFFICMTVFAGLSTLRLVLLQIQSIPSPAARLIVCSFSSTVHILFLIFIHFVYMHPSFKYGKNVRN